MRILILDDDLSRHKHFKANLIGHELTHTETAQECIDQIANNELFDYIFLDHDLGGNVYVESGKNTGYEVAQYLANNPDKIPGKRKVLVHSLNPVGAKNMARIIPGAALYPFAWIKVGSLIE
jgi:CheY-like chemotaxis protein